MSAAAMKVHVQTSTRRSHCSYCSAAARSMSSSSSSALVSKPVSSLSLSYGFLPQKLNLQSLIELKDSGKSADWNLLDLVLSHLSEFRWRDCSESLNSSSSLSIQNSTHARLRYGFWLEPILLRYRSEVLFYYSWCTVPVDYYRKPACLQKRPEGPKASRAQYDWPD